MKKLIYVVTSVIILFIVYRKLNPNKTFSVEVKGNEHLWSFDFTGNPKYWDGWEADGLNVARKIGVIPNFILNMGLASLWVKIINTIAKV